MEYEVNSGPALIERGKRGRTIYPFGQMKVNDFFDAPLLKESRLRSAAGHYGKNHGIKFTVIKMNGVIRCQRIA